MKCDLCQKYQMPKKDFSGENDAHLMTRFFYQKMIYCESCNDIIEKGERVDRFDIQIVKQESNERM